MKEAELPAALTDADNNLLLAFWMAYLVLMAMLPSTYKGFVNFDSAVQLR